MIIVTGATGATGREVVRCLVARGVRVRAVTRDIGKARGLSALVGAELVQVDTSQPEACAAVFSGVTAMGLVVPLDSEMARRQMLLIDAAKHAGVRRVVKISAMGADPNAQASSLRAHAEAEQYLAASGMSYTVVRPNSFAQNLLLDAATIRSMGRFFGCSGEARCARVDTRDIGEVVAQLLVEDGHDGSCYELTGSEALSAGEVASILSRRLGRTITYVDMSSQTYANALESAGLPAWLCLEIADIYGRGFFRDGGAAKITETVGQLLGRAPRSVEGFIEDHADAFRT